ncbi:MAG: SseB family protein [Pseudomonadota bacterium]
MEERSEGPITPLDAAHAAMRDAPDEDAARLRFYERLADGQLYLMLANEPVGDQIEPRLFPLEDGQYVLVYDLEERLARFAGGVTPYAALPGRRIAEYLQGRGIGLGLNLGGAPSEMLLPPDAVDWLAETLARRPVAAEAVPREVAPPSTLPELLLTALDGKLAQMQGLAAYALLAAVSYDTGARTHLLAFIDPEDGAEDMLARAVGEALTFSGLEAGTVDVTFLPADHVLTARLARTALRFDLPGPVTAGPALAGTGAKETSAPPGSDPYKPPKLR